MSFRMRAGLVPGRNHVLDGRNCQDALHHAFFEQQGRMYYLGVVADGCGSGRYSEVGAQLGVQFVAQALKTMLLDGTPLELLPESLFAKVITFLEHLLRSYRFSSNVEQAQFVREHLLFTLLGFVVSPEQTLVFASGDGLVVLNDEVHRREQNNTPDYISYHLLEQHHLREHTLPAAFDLYTYATEKLHRLAIGSDSWLQELPLLNEVWDKSGPASLQLSMNRWSDARHFKDDASMVLLERTHDNVI